ncbi:cbb3-type cytochrome c oxidase subunit I [Radiobacillus sp. PE A8.2]|uniref:cbb3-type cytochrome c oxidase subunit I n=1 Tax=Radiobacillus sp. PE A8.2 TaxID=3380349 RepID=UPI00388F02A0
MNFEISYDTLYQASDVIAAWIVSIIAFFFLIYLISKHQKWGVVWSYIRTTDHRKIGLLYLLSGVLFFFRGGMDALLIRTQLLAPELDFWVFQGDKYNGLFTTHGTVMIFFVAMPLLIGLMNVAVPLQIGAKDLAFPLLNSLSFWLFFSGALLFNLSFFLGSPPNAGWTAYAPLSDNSFTSSAGNDFYVFSLQISGLGTLLTAINMIVTIIRNRTPGMKLLRMPLFTWSTLVTSFLIIVAFSTLSAALFLLMFDRLFGTAFFNADGGNPVYWQHLFWIFGHPEVYVLALPAFGIFSDVISTFSKKAVFGYRSMIFSIILIGFLGFMVWVHHMFTVGLGPLINTFFAITTMMIAIPTGIKIFNWLFTMRGGNIQFTTPMLFAVGFIPSFVIGGVTGVMLAVPAADFQFHDSYFVVGHFHYVIIGATILGIFSGIYYWYPKITGKKLDETLGKWHFWLFVIGFHFTFMPMHFAGLQGMPRRVYTYLWEDHVFVFNAVSTVGAFMMGISMLFFIWNIYQTAKSSERVEADCWDGRTLEWTVASPPEENRFVPSPVVEGRDPLGRAKETNETMNYTSNTRAMPVSTDTVLPALIAGSMLLFSLAMIYGWLTIAGGLSVAILVLIICFSWRDPKKEVYRQIQFSKSDRQSLFKDKKLGFFGYLVIDATMFTILFVTYILFTPSKAGPDPSQLFEAKSVILSTIFLVSSSVTLTFSRKATSSKQLIQHLGIIVTFLLGFLFLIVEVYDFYHYWAQGYTISSSLFLSSFYVLVGFHAAHICFGLGWLIQLYTQSIRKHIPLTLYDEKMTVFEYYWHFVDLIWMFIILFVYLPYLV